MPELARMTVPALGAAPVVIRPARMSPSAPPAMDARDVQPVTLVTEDGRRITARSGAFRGSPRAWSATLRQFDRPGVVAAMVYGAGVREVTAYLCDGRRARARIVYTAFVNASGRVCEIQGLEAFELPSADCA